MSDKTQANSEAKSEQGDKDQTPKYLTEEEHNTKTNSIVTSRTKKLEQEIADLKALVSKQQASKEQADKEAEPKKTPHELRLENEINDLKTSLSNKDKQVADKSLRSSVSDFLLKNQANPEYISHAVGHLVDAAKLVQLDDDGVPVFISKGNKVTLEKGLSDWVNSNEARIYKLPKGAAGSGDSTKTAGTGKAKETSNLLGQLISRHGIQ